MATTMFDDETNDGKPRPTRPQSSTSGKLNWYWGEEDLELEVAMLYFELIIPKFEFKSIEEVDPVDA